MNIVNLERSLGMSYCPKCGSKVSEEDNYCANCANPLKYAAKHSIFRYGGFWRRLFSMFIDGIIMSGAWGIIAGIFNAPSIIEPLDIGAGGFMSSSQETMALIWDTIRLMMIWLYHASFESSKYQATPGKMALGIVVTDYQGERISFGKATGRYFAKIVSTIILLIGYIMAAFTEQKQALHDILAGTLVIKGRGGQMEKG